MRLTLRTLLAYLDDSLEPAETREIGGKIQESPVAQAMVSRIREVMRRRRLGAADLDGPGVGIDPNIVAQYLDNTLPPAEVGDVEKVFLESDQQLAEVAACHQILTIALGEPVDISKRSRERLYVLGPVEAGQKLHPAEPVHRGNGERTVPTPTRPAAAVVTAASPSFEETLPEYLRPKPWSGKILMVVGLMLLLAVWGVAVLRDRQLMSALMGLRPERSAPADVAQNDAQPAPAAAGEDGTKTEVAVTEPTPSEPEANPEEPVSAVVVEFDERPAEELVLTEIEMPADAALVVAVVTPEAVEPMPPTDNAPAAKPAMSAQFVSQEGVLLQLHPSEKRWYVVPRLSALKLGTRLACPEPFESVLDFNQGAMRVTLLGGTVVDVLKPSDRESAALRLVSGRMVLQTQSKEKENEPLRIGFAIGTRTGELEIAPADTLFGVEYLLAKPIGFEQPAPPESRLEGMYVLSGAVTWNPDGGEPRKAERGGVYLSLLTDQMPLNFGPPISSVPVWLNPQRRKSGATLARWARQFEQEFEATQPIDSSMLALIRDPRSKISELAVRCLSLTDNPTAVVQALAQADSEDARKAAADGLREWLGVSAKRGEQLQQALREY